MRARSFACHDALWAKMQQMSDDMTKHGHPDASVSRLVREALYAAYDPRGKLRAFQDISGDLLEALTDG